jgi:hypothetical protein
MFEGIGTIGSYAKQWKLKRMAKTKITTGQTVDLNKRQSFSSVFAQISTQNSQGTKKTTKTMAEKAKTNSIKQKLKQGKKLSAEELKHLKEKEPALYEKAKAVQLAREQLERDLKHCKTKGEVRMAMLRASMKVESQAAMADTAAAGVSMSGAAPSAGGAVAGTAGAAMSTGGAAASMDTAGVGGEAQALQGMNGTEGAAAAGEHAVMEPSTADVSEAAQKAQATGEKLEKIIERVLDENKGSAESSGALLEALEATEDAGMDLPPTQMLIIRALQDEYDKFVNSKEYEDLPEDMADKQASEHKKPEKPDVYKIASVCDAYIRAAHAAENQKLE